MIPSKGQFSNTLPKNSVPSKSPLAAPTSITSRIVATNGSGAAAGSGMTSSSGVNL